MKIKLQESIQKISFKAFHLALLTAAFVPGQALAQGLREGVDLAQPDSAGTDLFSIFQTIANTMLVILGAIAVIMLIIGGIRYVISQGDSSAIEGARNTILYAIIGLVVAFLAWAAVDFVVGRLES